MGLQVVTNQIELDAALAAVSGSVDAEEIQLRAGTYATGVAGNVIASLGVGGSLLVNCFPGDEGLVYCQASTVSDTWRIGAPAELRDLISEATSTRTSYSMNVADALCVRCTAIHAYRGFESSSANAGVLECTSIGASADTGISVTGSGSLVQNAVIDGTHDYGINARGVVYYATITGCTNQGLRANLAVTARNLIIANNPGVGIALDHASADVDYVDYWNNGTDLTKTAGTEPTHFWTDDPLFVDAGAGDYHLQAASLCRGRAIDVGVTVDRDNLPRTGPFDLGAYQVQATPPTVVSADDWSFTRIDVVFSEAMDPDEAALLNESLWAVTPLLGGPAVAVALVGIDPDFLTVHVIVTPAMGAATDYRVTAPATAQDAEGETIDPAGRSADFTTASGDVLSASTPTRRTVAVVFEFTPAGGSLLDATAWLLEETDGVSDVPAIESVTQDGATITLTLTGPLSPGGAYEVTAPADIPGIGTTTAAFVCDVWRTPLADEGVLEALTGAFGSQLAKAQGQPVTRLAAPLAPGDTMAEVESTLHMPATGGIVRIGPEKVPFGACASNQLTGLIRAANIVDTYPIGTEVRDENYEWGQARRAWAETTLSKCPIDFVDVAARDKGSPAPLAAMPAADRRAYAVVRHYLDAGTWWAAFRVLREGFRWASKSGSNAETFAALSGGVRRIDVPTASLPAADLHDRWIEVGGRILRVRVGTTGVAAGMTTLYVEGAGGPTWEPSEDLADATGVSWELLAFRLVECQLGYYEADRLLGLLVVYIYATMAVLPSTYLVTSGLATPQSRLMRGKLSPWETIPGHSNHQSFYLAQPYRTAVLSMIEDVVPAGVEIRVVTRRAP